MSKYKIGDILRFADKELVLSAPGSSFEIKIDTKDLHCKVTGSVVEAAVTYYFVETKCNGMVVTIKLREDQLLSPRETFSRAVYDAMKRFRSGKVNIFDFATPLISDPSQIVLGVDLGCGYAQMPKPKHDDTAEKKMSKDKCVKLLESYRAERAKVKAGRRFDRCLRDSVVDEALERAIELLNERA